MPVLVRACIAQVETLLSALPCWRQLTSTLPYSANDRLHGSQETQRVFRNVMSARRSSQTNPIQRDDL